MRLPFPANGHVWELVSPSDPLPVEAWVRYLEKYIRPYSLKAEKHPPKYFCKVCRICVHETGPGTEDANCVEVSVRHVMES